MPQTRSLTLTALATISMLVVPARAEPFVVIQPPGSMILDTTQLAQCVADFNADDRWFFGVVSDEEVSTINNGVYGGQFVKNADSYDYLKDKVPLFDCPDADFVKTYYFRWWTYRKHIKNLGTESDPDLIVTEFIDPVGWADPSNAINAPLGHQIYEGRWLQDQRVMTDYQRYWMTHASARPRHYSAWLSDAVLANHQVNPDLSLVAELLTSTTNRENLEINHANWINGVGTTGGAHRQSDGLFTQNDGYDAMEVSFGGSGKRPSINAYMYADARALAGMFRLAAANDPANTAVYNAKADSFDQQADNLRARVQAHLWDPADEFFKTGYNDFDSGGSLQARREQIGFTPWAFGLPEDGGAVDYDLAWSHLSSFTTPVGLTSGAIDETGYNTGAVGQCCRWDGPTWPFATTITLRAMANLLQDYQQGYIDRTDYFQQLEIYTDSQRQEFTQNGETRTIPWIDESMVSGGAAAGNWTQIGITRDGTSGNDNPRGLAYNHSGYVDLIVTGLAGLRPDTGELVRVAPLLPDDTWDWFLLDNIRYHGRYLTILWDKTGAKYGRGAGLKVYADGTLIASAAGLEEVLGTLATTPDTLITTTNPPDGATNLATAATTLTATFNRPIQAGTGTIDLMRSTGAGDVLVESFDVTSSPRLNFGQATLTISPTSPLVAAGDYHVLIDATAVQGNPGNPFAGITDPATWNFSTDGTPPAIANRTPEPGAPAVSTRIDLDLTFDEPVVKGTGTIVVRLAADGSAVQTTNVGTPDVTVDGNEVTVLLADLAVDTFYVEIDPGAFLDLSGNPFAGISGSAAWTFTTSATAGIITASLLDEESDIVNTGGALVSACHFQNPSTGDPDPLVVNGIPHIVGRNNGANLTQNMTFEGDFRNGASGLPQGGSDIVQVLLSGIAGGSSINMSISGLTPGKEYLFQAYWEANGTSPQHTLTMTLEGDTLDGVGPQGVPGGVLISYRFPAGDNTLNAFFDLDGGTGNNWLSGYSLQEIPSAGEPSLNATDPPDGATKVPTTGNLVAFFDKAVQPGSGSIAIYKSDDTLVEAIAVTDTSPPGTVSFSGNLVTIDPTAALEPGVSYYVLIGSAAITDDSANPFPGITDKTGWSFTTSAAANTIETSLLDEATDIINTGGTLVSACHFQDPSSGDPDPLVVNGIPHRVGSGSDPNLTDNFFFEGDYRNGGSGLPQDGSNIVQVLLSGIAGANPISMSVSGLTAGQEYLFQAYWEADLNESLTITVEGETVNLVQAKKPGVLISYQFTAGDDTLNAFFDRDDGGAANNWLSGYSLQEVAGSDFNNWIAGFPEVGGQTGFADDPDGDRIANGLEAWFGTHPGEFNAGLTGLTVINSTTTTFSHPQNEGPPSDVRGFYEWSPNLTNWYDGDGVAGPPGGPTVTISPATGGAVTTVTVTASGPLEMLFVRVGVTRG
jgi:hypothetical protein